MKKAATILTHGPADREYGFPAGDGLQDDVRPTSNDAGISMATALFLRQQLKKMPNVIHNAPRDGRVAHSFPAAPLPEKHSTR